MAPWESFQGRETGEWERDICAFNRTQRRRKEDKPPSFFGLVQIIFFACPLDSCTMGIMLQVILGMFQFLLLTRIPTSHAKVCMDHMICKMYLDIRNLFSWFYLHKGSPCWYEFGLLGSFSLVEVILWVNDTCHFRSRDRKTQQNSAELTVSLSNYFIVTSIASFHVIIFQ